MRKYDKEFKEEAVKLSDEIGVKQAAAQLGIPYYSLAEWRQKRKVFGDHAFVGSGIRRDAPLSGETNAGLIKENRRAAESPMRFLKDAWVFFGQRPETVAGSGCMSTSACRRGSRFCVHAHGGPG